MMTRRLFFSLLVLFAALPLRAQTLRSAETEAPARAGFGLSVAVAGDALFVGEPVNRHASGLVYVFARGEDAWTEAARLSASDARVGDQFGLALAADGDRLLVAAPQQDSARGAVYVFERDAAGAWAEAARLHDTSAAAGDRLGEALALDGDRALVGSSEASEETGTVHVWRKAADGWVREATLAAPGVEPGDRFGTAVALGGDLAFVGAPRQDSGAVYVFRRDGEAWTQAAKLVGSAAALGSRFGETLALDGGRLLVGAPRAWGNSGAVVAFRRGADGAWAEEGVLAAADDGQLRFGSSLALHGGEAWVGAPGYARRTGAAYRFAWDAETSAWAEVERIGADEARPGDLFATALAAGADALVAGATGDDYGAGTALVFERGDDGAWRQAQTVAGEIQTMAAVRGGQVDCTEGMAASFDCNAVDLVAFMPVPELGGERGVRVNDIWGWTDPETGKEYALLGRMDGTSFVDVSDPFNPVLVGELPKTEGTPSSVWRDVKVYRDHAFIVADAAGEHGMQVFDLTQLREVTDAPLTFAPTARYDRIHSAHNVVVNTESGFAYTVGNSSGGETCGGGLHMIDVRDPKQPTFAGCFADPTTGRRGTGYTHDAQCVNYLGPDAEHQGKEVCFNANETALSIADVTDKANPVALSRAAYPNVGYAHQGWLTEDHRYFYMNDELDELGGKVSNTRTLIWDVTDLDDPQLVREFLLDTQASDHNLYIDGRFMYQSNYLTGVRIFDISQVDAPVEVGYFDTVPYGENGPGFGGSWSNYPFFQSGVIVVSSMDEGLFVLKKRRADL